jgi:transcriptional regulator with PAS, ATPase and Fis domain
VLASMGCAKRGGDSVDITAQANGAASARDPRPADESREVFGGIVGTSARINEATLRARTLAGVNAPVLLQGETGVGKELFARAIHDHGRQSSGPFIALNCGGLPRELLASELFGYADGAFTGARRSGAIGKLEAASGGTLFLDEISEMPLELQPYLLRALEGGEVYPLGSNKPRSVQFRLVSACNRDLRLESSAGRFRLDLFYRLSVTVLQIPALRERVEDLPALVDHFARDVASRHKLELKTFEPDVMAALLRYRWPGNIRELRNVLESMVLLTEGEVVRTGLLPPHLRDGEDGALAPAEPHTSLRQVERETIREALCFNGGNLTRAARDLRIARSTLYLKVKKYALTSLLNDIRRDSSGTVRSE